MKADTRVAMFVSDCVAGVDLGGIYSASRFASGRRNVERGLACVSNAGHGSSIGGVDLVGVQANRVSHRRTGRGNDHQVVALTQMQQRLLQLMGLPITLYHDLAQNLSKSALSFSEPVFFPFSSGVIFSTN